MNKQTGNMYPFVKFTWNPIRGECSHDCKYCYMKVWPQKPIRLDEKALMEDLGHGKTIFVGSSTDMFAEAVPAAWITRVLDRCDLWQNIYLFQTKNPERFLDFSFDSDRVILAGTIESNIDHDVSKAPQGWNRAEYLQILSGEGFKVMVSIEPVMDFTMNFVEWIRDIRPFQVSIGADSKGHKLPEPSPEKVRALIAELETFTAVIQKDNLKRLLK
jgi:DNA repair photolyase